MSNENKYYTPELWEFCEGFEYEIFSNLTYKWVCKNFNIQTDVFLIGVGFRDGIRVKCLDKADIESLGFVWDSGYGYASLFQRDDCDIMTQNGKFFKIHAKNGNYEGTLRNKFHLQQILNDVA